MNRQLGPYVLLDELGRGAWGVVLRARDTRTGRVVAIKRLLGQPGAGPGPGRWSEQELGRFRREAEAGLRVRHPNVAALLETGQDELGPWHAFEYVEGEDLERVLRRAGPLPVRRVVEIGVSLAEALAAAHAQGVLHRDLKPGNVLIDARGAPRLTDFGLARVAEGGPHSLTATGEVVGTPVFMAPEQALGDKARIGPPADVYGLGATLFALLTGRPPFVAATIGEVLRRVHGEPAPDPRSLRPEVDPALARVVARCLEKSPDQRFVDMHELAAALRRCLGPDPALVATQRSEAGRPRSRRGARAALVFVGAAVGLGALIGAALVLRPGEAVPSPAEPVTSVGPQDPPGPSGLAAEERPRTGLPDPELEARRARGLELLDAGQPEQAFQELAPLRDDPQLAEALAARIPDPARLRLLWLAFVPESGPLEEAALLVAKLVLHPELEVGPSLARLDALAERVRPRLAGEGAARFARLVELVHAEGVRGADLDYADPENSCLEHVLTRGRGIQITCSLVLVAVARRLGVELDGVCFPGKFLVRDAGSPPLLADPYSGQVLTVEEARAELAAAGGPAWAERFAQPSPRPLILIRLAYFLARRLHEQRQRAAAERAERVVLTLAPRETDAVVQRAFGGD